MKSALIFLSKLLILSLICFLLGYCVEGVSHFLRSRDNPMASVTVGNSDESRQAEADETHALLEKLALKEETVALSRRDALLLEAQKEYEKDFSEFNFHCERSGDFLTIHVTRMCRAVEAEYRQVKMQARSDQKFSVSMDLKNVQAIKLVQGHAPDKGGELGYYYSMMPDKNDGTIGRYATGQGNAAAPEGFHWEVRSDYTASYRDALFTVMPSHTDKVMANVAPDPSYSIKHKTKEYVRPAKDDEIVFEGISATLYVPAGKGEEVRRQILRAKDQ